MIPSPHTKTALRQQAKQRRAQWPAVAKQAIEGAIQRHVQAWVGTHNPATILGYWPLASELSLIPCYEAWYQEGKAVYLPVVTSASPTGPPVMAFYLWQPGVAMETNRYGIAEPSTALAPWLPSNVATSPTVMLLPALAVDEQGYRVGYGGGYYDAFLTAVPSNTPLSTLAVCEEAFKVPAISDTAPHDAKVQWVASEGGVVHVA